MKRLCSALLLLAVAAPVQAHFVWLLPGPAEGEWAARVIFSDSLEPDRDLFKKVASAELFAGDTTGKATPVKARAGKDALEVTVPGKGQRALLGVCTYGVTAGKGLYGVRVSHIEEKAGEAGGKEYQSVRHYSTVTLPAPAPAAAEGEASGGARLDASESREGEVKANPEATKLLADARAARATWRDFPGFTADLEVNVEGKVTTGKLEVSRKGAVKLELGGEGAGWARRTLESIIGHRLDNSAALKTPCAFVDEVKDHPLGRAIRVLNDEFHSSYRIRDRQVIVVNRQAGTVRFTITVMENELNAEKHFLPACYVVNTWDLKGEALRSSATHHQTWQRVGKFDLPRTATVVTATAGKQEVRGIKLSNHRLK